MDDFVEFLGNVGAGIVAVSIVGFVVWLVVSGYAEYILMVVSGLIVLAVIGKLFRWFINNE